MFRQKIDEVTNCTCRLIPNDKNDSSIFRPTVYEEKSVHKDHKEKYSLKTQAISSGKTDPKNISDKKSISNASKIYEDDRISITGNIDSKKKKLDRYKICSPDGYIPRNFDETMTPSESLPKNEKNFSKGAYIFKTRDQNRQKDEGKSQVDESDKKTFGALKKFTIAHQNARAILTSYSSSQKNKQNALKATNLGNEERPKQKADKSLKKIRDNFEHQLPLRQISSNINYQITHGSLQKYEKGRDQFSRLKDEVNFQTSRMFEMTNMELSQRKIENFKQQYPNNSSMKIVNFYQKSIITQGNGPRGEYSQSEEFISFLSNMRGNSVEKVPTKLSQTSRASSINNKQLTHRKAHTFNDLIGEKKLSESILSDQQENENENSIVVMTFKELIEKNKVEKQKQNEDYIKKLSFIKNTNKNEVHKASILTTESDLLTKLKPFQSLKLQNGLS